MPDTTDAVLVGRDLRIAMWDSPERADGYAALYLTQDDGQWSLALDGSWANAPERSDVLLAMIDLVSARLGVSPFPRRRRGSAVAEAGPTT